MAGWLVFIVVSLFFFPPLFSACFAFSFSPHICKPSISWRWWVVVGKSGLEGGKTAGKRLDDHIIHMCAMCCVQARCMYCGNSERHSLIPHALAGSASKTKDQKNPLVFFVFF
ncbi:hypothetical protein BD289DRAFT_158106 [Coniella lustricola]|uniref:Secreted protein n=1 Tax=Coniella lustricola TaxID=2025994 RepID=A0A2T3AMN7_9PEZI|nr:hypothetical protein BD289DRAFT_158106 [Coniella lustricola]